MFSKDSIAFLDDLAANNNRTWFEENRSQYEALVREPARQFIAEMAPLLETFAPHFRADPRKSGGSLMRVFRDTRFSRDKTPYKTNIGIQFRHATGKDVHAPGLYVHIASDECFLGVGCWHPDGDSLARIRDWIAHKPERWFAVRDESGFVGEWTLSGESLTRPPRGYPADHEAIEDLKRKDFIAIANLSPEQVLGKDFASTAGARFAAATPFLKFLCDALAVEC
ncbi:MAG: hypothetical protein AW11_02746 [Candidatus Accumulibacter regalis]|jgi:uncharacterized protein (TIGR02453 family)|uniref:TIGR02453 family protein n=1 Tax=Accumulibacter regalis TaxID=522306 RepID=A0A011PHT9_ACCRE|nr:DUF2461 domain-containing protein [Accumulibacter sp.]EXI87136.1 MAG: hypothetical protein AW11_02746 [Candidatus Accumulibacter regalis]MQM33931.1 DUF2461 domain-containing protein [Candidatus Accumulibacter phosphatis]MBL8367202.1 DUF2461 domain-containing protein [Accumulibacter sp.]MBN8515715.1 DUF2461 domain-containing protein [Accumulibacter sp.]MBO3702429.1 DUF2461 domain-containing protein [Accumulibacter sp.]